MAWPDRLIEEAIYTSPSGIPFTFEYEDVSRETDKKTSTFIFPEVDGAFIQDLGRAGRRYPFTVYFSGADYDLTADAFLAALEEKGVGTLIHPRYGIKSVVPTGTITQADNLVTAANQAVFNVTFSETLTGLTFPASLENILTKIKTSVSVFQTVSSAQFETDVIIDTASGKIAIEQELENQRIIINTAFGTLIKVDEEINAAFTIVNNSFVENISNAIDTPGIVAGQLITLMRIPSEITNETSAKINSYDSIITIETDKFYTPQIFGEETNNAFKSNQIQAFSGLAASCESVLSAEFTTRPQVIEVSENLLNSFDNIKLWQDTALTDLSLIDTGESYESLLNLVSLATIYLIDLSFDLPAQRIIKLGEDRNIIELVSELYGGLDQIDFFITTNDLTADEIEILPQGKEVVFYV